MVECSHSTAVMMTRRLVGAGIFSIYSLLLAVLSCETCPSRTEIGHLGATVYSWETFRFDVYAVNPPLARFICGLPVLLYRPTCDFSLYSSCAQVRCELGLGAAVIAQSGPEITRSCFRIARWSLIPLLLLGAYFGYRLCQEMYGYSAAFVFLLLWCSSPLLLAWGATICPDAVAAALGVVAVYTLRQWLREPNWMRAAIAGVCLGLLPLTKLTWIIAFGIWPVIWCVWTLPIYLTKADKRCLPLPSLRQLATILLIGLYTLNMGYLCDGTFRPLGKYAFISQLLRGGEVPENQQPLSTPTQNRFAGTWLSAIPVPLPTDFVRGIDTQRLDFERGLPSYLRGQWADHGWWYYYLYALLVKEPLGTWCLVALAIGATIFGRGYSALWRDEMLVLVPLGGAQK